jgi:uncharacterized iron-regulated protein
MKVLKKSKLIFVQPESSGWIVFWAVFVIFLVSCAVTPTKKLLIKNTAQSFDAGTIISSKAGRSITFDELLADLDRSRIIYIGEKHTNADHHKIQLEIIQAVFRKHPNMAVGMEMFDHTYQDLLNLWSAGKLDQREFLRKVHWYANWRYDFSLYGEILEFIKENHIQLVGLNIPFHIPPKIRVGGIENLRDDEKKHLPLERDTSNEAHKEYVAEVFKHHNFSGMVEFEDFYMAQSVWEDAMAEAISQNLNDDVMVVLAGNGHIQFKYGIPDRAYRLTGEPFRTIYLEPAGGELELDVADYIWVTN